MGDVETPPSVSSEREKPVCISVMPPVSRHGRRRDWLDLERFYNPEGVFREVNLVSVGEPDARVPRRFGTVLVHPVVRPRWTRWVGRQVTFLLFHLTAVSLYTAWIAWRRGADVCWQRYASPLMFGVPCLVTARVLRLPCVVTLNNDYEAAGSLTSAPSLHRRTDPALWRWVLRGADRVVAVSEFLKKLPRRLGVSETRMVTIPNKEFYHWKFGAAPRDEDREAADRTLPDAAGGERPELLVTVARMVRQKNVVNLVDAVSLVLKRRPRLRWILVGDGPLREEVSKQIREAGIESNVIRFDRLSHRRLAAYFQRADLMLFATLFEGQGRVTLEAFAAGLPVVGSSFPPFTELIDEGRTGTLVDPTRPEAIAEGILRGLELSRKDEEVSERCRRKAQGFEVEVVNRAEASLFLDLLGPAARARRRGAGELAC